MLIMTRKEYIEEIMYRHFSKEASDAEEAQLASWLEEDPANKQEYETLLKIWNESGELSHGEVFNQTAAWATIEKKISSFSAVNDSFKIHAIFRKPTLVAAAIVALTFLAWITYYLIEGSHLSGPISVLAIETNKEVHLPDGSVVIVRAGSELKYDHEFAISNRNMQLSGEAFFDIAHNENLKCKIRTVKSVIEVLGTSFTINSNADSDQVFVTRGTVKFEEAKDEKNMVILSAGQRSSLIGKVFEKDTIENTNYLSWKSGILLFEGVSLKSMINDINNHYHAHIMLPDSLSVMNDTMKVNFRFEKNSLTEVLDEIQLTTGLKAEKRKDSILLHE
jgi:transmembrane sensor